MVLKRIGVWSAARISGALYGGFGLVFGAIVALVAVVPGGFAQAAGENAPPAFLGALFGVGAVIFMPIMYGILGVVGGALTAWLYNTFARLVGGLEVELQ